MKVFLMLITIITLFAADIVLVLDICKQVVLNNITRTILSVLILILCSSTLGILSVHLLVEL